MKRLTILLAVLALLFCGCAGEASVVGCWKSDTNTAFYFELYEDGSCTMFNGEDEWVSAGTYTVHRRQVAFEMDTGSFVWKYVGDVMQFQAGDTVTEYHRITK